MNFYYKNIYNYNNEILVSFFFKLNGACMSAYLMYFSISSLIVSFWNFFKDLTESAKTNKTVFMIT